MPVIKAVIEYDGTDFSGYQKQPSKRTVQGVLEQAIGTVFSEPATKTTAAGRTDAGVHAIGQVVGFIAPDWFPSDRICIALNGALPADVKIRSAREVCGSFHARYSAKSRKYLYVVLNREASSAFLARYTWHVRDSLDLRAMQTAGNELIGTHDFASFGLPYKPGSSTIRRIVDIRTMRRKDAVILAITANAFLRGMARAIAGTLVEVGCGRRVPEEMQEILEARSCQAVHKIAPAQGLFLTRVCYHQDYSRSE